MTFNPPGVHLLPFPCLSPIPPSQYYLAQMPTDVPLFVISGGNDWFSDPPNIARLLSQLPNPAAVRHLQLPLFSHLDFLIARSAPQLVQAPVLAWLQRGYALVAATLGTGGGGADPASGATGATAAAGGLIGTGSLSAGMGTAAEAAVAAAAAAAGSAGAGASGGGVGEDAASSGGGVSP